MFFYKTGRGLPQVGILVKDIASRIHTVARVLPYPIIKMGLTVRLPIIPDHDYIERSFLWSVVEIETQYLTASLERLTQIVNALFETAARLLKLRILNFTNMLAIELEAARSDRQLKRTAINNIATAIRLYTS